MKTRTLDLSGWTGLRRRLLLCIEKQILRLYPKMKYKTDYAPGSVMSFLGDRQEGFEIFRIRIVCTHTPPPAVRLVQARFAAVLSRPVLLDLLLAGTFPKMDLTPRAFCPYTNPFSLRSK